MKRHKHKPRPAPSYELYNSVPAEHKAKEPEKNACESKLDSRNAPMQPTDSAWH